MSFFQPSRVLGAVCLGLALLFGAGAAYALDASSSPEEKKAFIESLAQPLPEPVRFYRWQTKKSGDTLIREASFTDKLLNYFMGMDNSADYLKAGRGIYASEDPFSASQFARGGDEGSLIHVNIAAGSPTLDLANPAVLQKLEQRGLTVKDVYSLEPRVNVKYDGANGWWVLRNQQGVSFQAFDGSALPLETLVGRFKDLAHRRAKRIYSTAVRPYLVDRAAADPALLANPELREVLGKDHTLQAATGAAERVHDRATFETLNKVIEGDAGLRHARNTSLRAPLDGAEARVTDTAEIVKRFGGAEQERASYLFRAKLQQMTDEGQYLKALGDLRDRVQGDLHLRLLFDPEDLVREKPALTHSSEGSARATQLLGEIRTGEAEVRSLLKSTEQAPFLERVNALSRLMRFAERPGTTPALRAAVDAAQAELFGPNGSLAQQLTKLSSEERVGVLREALPHLKGEELLKLLQTTYTNRFFDKPLGDFLAGQEERIRDWNLPPATLRELADYASESPAQKLALLKTALRPGTSPADALALLKPNTRDFSTQFKTALSAFLEENFAQLLALHPTTDETVKLIDLAFGLPARQQAMLTIALEEAKKPADFLNLAAHGLSGAKAEQETIKDFIHAGSDAFLALKPSPKEIDALQALLGPTRNLKSAPSTVAYLAKWQAENSGLIGGCARWFKSLLR